MSDTRELNLVQLHNQLLDILLTSKDALQDIVSVIYKTLELPITILNPAYTILASAPKEKIGDKYWDSALENGTTPTDLVFSLNDQKITPYAYSQSGAFLLEFGDITYKRILSIIRTRKYYQGFLSIYLIHEDYPTDLLIDIANYLTRLLKIHFALNRDSIRLQSDLQSAFISRLFSGKISHSELERWKIKSGLQIVPGYALAAVQYQPESPGIIDFLDSQISLISSNSLEKAIGDVKYYLFYNLKSDLSWKELRRSLEKTFSKAGVFAGYSFLFDDILQMQQYMQQASLALQQSRPASGGASGIGYEEAQYSIMLSMITRQISPSNCLHRHFITLSQYDAQYGTSYLQTLYVYLNTNCNVMETKDVLFLHRNTVLYRLKKIEEICDFSFKDTDTVRSMMLCSWTIEESREP